MSMPLDLRQSRNHDFAEVSLILSIECHHGGFVRSNNRFTRSYDTVVGLSGQLIGQQQQYQAPLQKILQSVSFDPIE